MNKGGSAPSIPDPWDFNFKFGNDGSTIHVDSDLDNIRIKEIGPITTTSTVNSDTKLGLKIEPLDVTSNSTTASSVDLKPVVVDSCQTIKIAPLPPMRMEQPYSQHFGFVFMGVELFGFNTSGSYETLLNNPARSASCCGQQPDGEGGRSGVQQTDPAVTRSDGGLRVRIGR
ncbi:MAG TPA: hypothetical protein PLF73_00640 [Luteimonas sp.]|nr:hypothetical protein [Luteimonas sp.]